MVGWGGRHRRVAGPHTQSLNSPTRSEPNDRGISRDVSGTFPDVSGMFPGRFQNGRCHGGMAP